MMSKKTSRVQGSWAASAKSSTNTFRTQNVARIPTITKNCGQTPTASKSFNWAGKQIANNSTRTETSNVCFQSISPNELKGIPKVQYIRQNGEHSLGFSINGESKLVLKSDFLESSDADWMFETLLNEIHWKQQNNNKYGTDYMEPRLTQWFSDYSYSYSGVLQTPNSHWHPLITALCDRINDEYRLNFNSVLANYYRDGHDSVDWHTDAEPALGRCPPIASISFGDTRNFDLRQISESNDADDFAYSRKYRIPLTHGSLLLMLGATQHDWQHRVPKEYHDRKGRINLTFRLMHPDMVERS